MRLRQGAAKAELRPPVALARRVKRIDRDDGGADLSCRDLSDADSMAQDRRPVDLDRGAASQPKDEHRPLARWLAESSLRCWVRSFTSLIPSE